MNDLNLKPSRIWRLPELLQAGGIRLAGPIPPVAIHQVTDDSRRVRPGALFVAVRGTRADGHRFVEEAVRRGARVVFVESPFGSARDFSGGEVFFFSVDNTRALLGPLVHAFTGAPSRKLKVVGITGTNGKTTVSWLTQHLLNTAGIPCGLMGTVVTRIGEAEYPSENTTPGVTVLQAALAKMLARGLKACSMEVSSHALDQHRVDGIRWACGVFTNLTPEHLDYHETMERYLEAKLRLFEQLEPDAVAVVNQDDPVSETVKKAARSRLLTYRLVDGSASSAQADLVASKIFCTLEGTTCEVKSPEGTFSIRWGLIGRHNVQNLLASLGAVMGCGVPLRSVLPGIENFPGVPGRLERIEAGQPFPILVDYAHTEEALRSVLTQLRAATRRRILLVFGCGGDRDRTKRPRMGQVAEELADRVIVTSDNPRSEDPRQIAGEISAGMKGQATPWEMVLDRRQAIRTALKSMEADGLLLIAGKGHETGQIVKDRVIPFDDRAVVREWLRAEESAIL